ncbi:hypothetical protein FE257_006023 [Aspergillus nanangensis]|uniref:Uncharacterized protein n=1 Tax=Aspergillus nanangensis TaxID=2582783 RepID=A0AAD4CPM5_ASPNN|nr:hypothetical protein FE257_006023 [Aspergillus nanangensis]
MSAPPQTGVPVQQGQEWSSGFWDCCSPAETCFFGWCLPCCLHGKTQSRLEDPQMKEESYMNGNCLMYFVTSYCALHWIPLMMKRGEMRKRFNIEGSGFSDCMSSYCCPCCVLVQHEKEVEAQASRHTTGYQAPLGMTYPTKQ